MRARICWGVVLLSAGAAAALCLLALRRQSWPETPLPPAVSVTVPCSSPLDPGCERCLGPRTGRSRPAAPAEPTSGASNEVVVDLTF